MKISFAVGSALLVWALVALVGVFEDEHREQRALLDHEQRTLSTFARARFVELIEQERAARQADVERALNDPLAPFDGEIFTGGERVRPLWSRDDLAAFEPTIKSLTLILWTGRPVSPTDDNVLAARLRHLDELRAAKTRASFEAAAGRFFLHRERHLLAPKWEISSSLAALAILVNQDLAPVELGLLREAFYGSRGALRKGAITHLMDARTRERVPRADLEAALALARSLAKDAGVLDPRTDAQVRELLSNAPAKTAAAQGVFIKTGAIRVVNATDDVSLPLDPLVLLEKVELPRDVSLSVSLTDTFASVPEIHIDDAPFAEARARLDRRKNLKRSLLVGLSLLWIVVVALTFALLRRRQRFVELKDTFVRAVTHELKTPLASIRLQAETLERKLKGDPRARDYPARIVKDIDGLGFLVENLLSFSRLERGRITPKTAPTSLDDLINESRQHIESIVRKPMTFTIEGTSGITLDIDSDLVRLCLDNLAKNAAQYNNADVVELSIRANVDKDTVRVTYRDNGVGIPEEERARIFEDFFRGQNRAAPARGSGLGLAICDAVMSAHGGAITLVASGPQGTTFALDFPRG